MLQLRERCLQQEKALAAKDARIAELEGGTGERSLGQDLIALEAAVVQQREAHNEALRAAAQKEAGLTNQLAAIELRHDRELIAVEEQHKDSSVGQLIFYLSEVGVCVFR